MSLCYTLRLCYGSTSLRIEKRSRYTDSDAGGSGEFLELEPNEIITEIDAPFGELPVRAIRAAQKRRDRIIPSLVSLIERGVQETREGRRPEGNGRSFALAPNLRPGASEYCRFGLVPVSKGIGFRDGDTAPRNRWFDGTCHKTGELMRRSTRRTPEGLQSSWRG